MRTSISKAWTTSRLVVNGRLSISETRLDLLLMEMETVDDRLVEMIFRW